MTKKPKHVCPERTVVRWRDWPVEKVVYKENPYMMCIGLLFFVVGVACVYYTLKYPLTVKESYAVYRPDKETDAKLAACQDSWRDDQVTIKLLRMKVNRLEAP